MESESDAAGALPPEQELTEALLSLSWPLPRTVQDADAALTRLEEVRAVLTRLEQQSVGTDAWWAGQVDGLATQSGFVLEWWRPVLRDPDLDWTLNHQAHLTADLATLASAGARLLDQIEPRAAEEAAAAMHARRVEQEKRWGPAAVPPFKPTGPKPHAPGARPQPPERVFGEIPSQDSEMVGAAGEARAGAETVATGPAAYDAPPVAAPPSIPPQTSTGAPAAASASTSTQGAQLGAATSETSAALAEAQTPSAAPIDDPTAAPTAAPPSEAAPTSARHRRPAYDFDDPRHATPSAPAPHPVAFPTSGAGPSGPAAPPSTPRGPLVPGPGFGGPPQGRTLGPGAYPPPGNAYAASPSGPAPGLGHARPGPNSGTGPFGFTAEDEDDEPDSLVPASLGLRRHQRRLLIQTGAVLGAIGALCWWAAYTLSSSPSHASAAADPTHTAGAAASKPATSASSTANATAAGGLTNDQSSSPTPTATAPSSAPSTATSSVPDATTVSSVHVTLLGGSSTVPQIVALITVNTAGTGQVTVTGAYYGASGSRQVAAESERWTLSGKTSYQYSVPIANSAYCGTEFHFTASAGGHSASDQTGPGC